MRVGHMPDRGVYLLVVEGCADWEPAHAVAELRRHAWSISRRSAQRTPIAAICGATVAIVRFGLVRGRRHTSNGLEYLRSHVPGYAEAAHYVDMPAVRDRGLITASGLGDVEFARELFEELNVLTAPQRDSWARIFRSARLPDGRG